MGELGRPRRVFITAAEHSGESHAAKLAAALRRLDPTIQLRGLGGPAMAAAGVELLADTVSNAAMGLRALLRAREVSKLLKRTRDHFDAHKPDLQICVDSWTMNSHFAALAKSRGVPVLYYVAPQTWASREGRLKKMRRVVDRLCCILPFEEMYFRSRGIEATFVGHPLFDDLPPGRDLSRPAPHFPDAPPVIGLPCGSRRSVAKANFPRQLKVADRIKVAFPTARFLVPTTPLTHPIVAPLIAGRTDIEAVEGDFDAVVKRCDVCVTVSGTAALHIAAWGVPLVVVYHGNPLLWHAIGRWMIRTRTYSLVNLLNDARRHIAPEFIPWYGSTKPVADCAIDLLRQPEKLAEQRAQLLQLTKRLERRGASERAAKIALQMLESAG
jgi:lipid-A-disaccharide synthase